MSRAQRVVEAAPQARRPRCDVPSGPASEAPSFSGPYPWSKPPARSEFSICGLWIGRGDQGGPGRVSIGAARRVALWYRAPYGEAAV